MIRILRGRELALSDVEAVAILSKDIFPIRFVLPIATLKKWYRRNKDIFIVAKKGDRTIGYLITVPLTTKAYKKTYTDDFYDKDISVKEIRRYDKEGLIHGHLCSIAIDPLYRHSRLFYKKMLGAYIDLLYDLAIKGIFISEVSANPVSIEGERICSYLNMRHVKTLGDHTKIFATDTVSEVVSTLSMKGKKLYDLYSVNRRAGASRDHANESPKNSYRKG